MPTFFSWIAIKENAEWLFYLTQIVLPIVAIGTLIFAIFQIQEAQRTTEALRKSAETSLSNYKIIATQAQATLLLSIEERWNGPQLSDSRKIVGQLLHDAKGEVFAKHHSLNEGAVRDELRKHCTVKLDSIRNDPENKDLYSKLLRYCGFFELVGLLIKKGYVKVDDVDGLLRGPIINVGDLYAGHIANRQKEKGVPPGLYENALYLCREVENNVLAKPPTVTTMTIV